MRCIYFDCFSGAAGDMILGAMLDAGLDFERLKAELAKLNLDDFHVEAERAEKRGITGTRFSVVIDGPQHAHRHLSHIVKIINESGVGEGVKKSACAVFQRLAEAEAGVHGTSIEKVHFHEVGAIDAIVDVVGACIGLELLGIDEVVSSPLRTGTGFIDCAHGRLPVPAPATAKLLEGYPVAPSDVEAELLTPTGAAILTTLADRFGSRPAMTVQAVGYGAGTRDIEGAPNVLRVFVGETAAEAEADHMWVLETNIDDMPAEFFGALFERLLAAGALDVYTTPILMKKGRPALKLSVIVSAERKSAAEEIIFRETTTFGIRSYEVSRRKLARESVTVNTEFGDVPVKLGRLAGELVSVSPEYDDCRRIAAERGIALKAVYEAARLAAKDIV